jgi:hypothetical protein
MSSVVAPLIENLAKTGASKLIHEGIQSAEYILEKQGGASALLGKLLRTVKSNWETDAGKNAVAPLMQDMEHMIPDRLRSAEFHDAHINGKMPSDRQTATASIKSKKMMFDEYTRWQQKGFKTAPLEENYFPLMYPREMFEKGTKENKQALGFLTDPNGRFKMSSAQAEHTLSLESPTPPMEALTGKFHPLESPRRLNLPEMARRDPAVVMEYLVGAKKRYHEAVMFGQKGEKAQFLLDQIGKESGRDAQRFASQVYSHFMGHAPAAQPLEKAIRSWEVGDHLGLAVLSHSVKTIQGMMLTGIGPMIKSLSMLGSEMGREEFKETAQLGGVAVKEAVKTVRKLAGVEHENFGGFVLGKTGFNAVVSFQEALYANMGKLSAIEQFGKYTKNPDTQTLLRLKTLGIDAKQAVARGGLTEQEVQTASHQLARISLGGRTVLDVPLLWKSTAAGRMLTMFKPFIFDQGRFVKDHIIKPALRSEGRDLRPLMYAAILFPTFGEITADVRKWAHGQSLDDRPKHYLDRIAEDLSQVGSFGMLSDMLNVMWSGQPGGTLEFLGGPVASDAEKLFDAPKKLFSHDGRGQLEKEFLRSIPTIGPALSRHLFPPKRPYKNFFEKGGLTNMVKKGVKALTP